ncbi:MAG: tRNA (guanine(10)-N2)-dimethyltransferase [Methanosaeta sp. PtaU1.Bin028]|nr:MAG: tRNA (guanine(10)-N2)-dimethyltransferase [Methanosaeta sp. PtaU1.Bin028]
MDGRDLKCGLEEAVASELWAFELSGEHATLPRSEALALLKVHSSSFKEVCLLDQCLIVRAPSIDAAALEARLAMSHRVLRVLAISSCSHSDLSFAASSIDIPRQTYRVRARSVGRSALSGYDVEVAVGRELFRRGYRADLSAPCQEIRCIVSQGLVVLGVEVARPDRSGFEGRRPHLKPFFYPGVLMPRMARALVNLTCVRPGERLLDPFSGTAGILVEAGLIGTRCVGLDVQMKIVRGSLANIDGIECSLLAGDARRLPFRDASVQAVVTDPPYGRSAAIRAASRDELLARSFEEMARVLQPGRRAVVVADHPIDDLLASAGFLQREIHSERVHRSLTRRIYISEI